ncbi:MAG TPA: ABC transporter permease [Bryobacteraceae bacterium]|nr:ABC transporter permease [Bryobacteraceae bacterium]
MRFYQALLLLYPKSFRAEYGEEMCAVYGRRGASRVSAVLEVLRNAPAAHADILRQDLRQARRSLARTPGFAIAAILVLALAIGANTAVFSVTDYALIRPLPFPHSDRLVHMWENLPGYSRMELSPVNYRDWKRMTNSYERMAAMVDMSANLIGQGNPERIDAESVTGDFFSVLGVTPVIGRSIAPADARNDAPLTAVLSYSLYENLFGGDPAVLGRKISLDGSPYVVIGVMPPDFRYPDRDAELWRPLQLPPDAFEDRNDNYLRVVARLRPGMSLEQARAEMDVVTGQLRRQYPRELRQHGASINLMRDEISSRTRLLLVALDGAALCVILIACTNLAGLLLARALARRRELAVRTALGAGRERIVRQLVTESLVLALLGGVAGVLVAAAALPLLTRLMPTLPVSGPPSMDLRVLGFAAVLTAFTGFAFGAIPAARVCRRADLSDLGDRSHAVTRQTAGLRSALILGEVTLSLVLVISAGLLLRALARIQSADPGFRTEGVLTLETPLPMPKYKTLAKRDAFYRQVLSDVQALPGVSAAGYISFMPMTMTGGIWPVDIDGKTLDRSAGHSASLRFITPGFFSALQIPLHTGRNLAESDNTNTQAVAVVSESFARRYWPGQNALGHHFRFGLRDRTIVGVVGDIRVRGLEGPSEPQVYLPYVQQRDDELIFYAPQDLAIRASGNAAALLPAIRRIVHRAEPEEPISHVRMLADIVQTQTAARTVQVRILGAFAVLALLLAGVGIHGLLSFTVSNRAGELAVRIALGAQRRDILRLVLVQSLALSCAAIVLGVVLAWGAAHAMQALLAGVSPADSATFLIAVSLCFAMALAGSLIPALRALRVDPLTALRA